MTQRTVPSPALPDATDDMLATQPFGYWGGLAHRSVISHIRDAMARVDVTQPQWWTLNRVLAGDGPTPESVAEQLAPVTDHPREAPRVTDQLLHRGWLAVDADRRLSLTDAGRDAHARIKRLVTDLRAEIHEGISDEEYVITLKVLRRMIDNVNSAATGTGTAAAPTEGPAPA
ncbi:MarR family winged helix-turn-helix transcriptional regulator [Streptomyces sp. DT171]|uniref:MarR family winged helix-turn-helix transcriptional regulator n=1 Tax=Streptomyces sp. DT171 TaxID=3416524 RepID=UPI003CF3DCAC